MPKKNFESAGTDRASLGPQRVCLVILGMHRSGTSALTRVMSLLGAELPKNVLGSTAANESGHWEPERLVALHDQMLGEAGTSWDDFRIFSLNDLSPSRVSQFRAAISQVVAQEFGDAPLIVLKDPRICRFAPFYTAIMEGMGYQVKFIHMMRNPLSVAASLAKRDGMPLAFSNLIWLRYVLDAEVATRGQSRIFWSYEALMADWRALVAAVNGKLGLNWTVDRQAETKIDEFLNREQTHHRNDAQALLADDQACNWLKSAYRLMSRLEADPGDAAVLTEVDGLRADFDHAARHMGEPVLLMMRAYLSKFAATNETLRRTVIELNERLTFSARCQANAS